MINVQDTLRVPQIRKDKEKKIQNYLRSEQLKGHENKTQSEVLDGILEQKEIPEEEENTGGFE